MSSTSPLTILAMTTAVPGQEAALRAAQEQLVAETVKEPGCIRYELHQSLEDGRILVFMELWENEETWTAHMNGDAIRRFEESGGWKLVEDFKLYKMQMVADGNPAIQPTSTKTSRS